MEDSEILKLSNSEEEMEFANKEDKGIEYSKTLRSRSLKELELYLKKYSVDEEIEGETLLHWAVYMANSSFVEKLISNGANINQRDALNRTVLELSLFYNFHSITDYLLEKGAVMGEAGYRRVFSGENREFPFPRLKD